MAVATRVRSDREGTQACVCHTNIMPIFAQGQAGTRGYASRCRVWLRHCADRRGLPMPL